MVCTVQLRGGQSMTLKVGANGTQRILFRITIWFLFWDLSFKKEGLTVGQYWLLSPSISDFIKKRWATYRGYRLFSLI